MANFLIFARLLVFEQRLVTLQAVSQNFWSQNGHVLVTSVWSREFYLNIKNRYLFNLTIKTNFPNHIKKKMYKIIYFLKSITYHIFKGKKNLKSGEI